MIQSNENSHLFSKSGVTDKSPNEETIKGQEKGVILEEERSFAKATLSTCSDSNFEGTKVLGISWDSSQDSLIFNIAALAENVKDIKPTKRNVLKASQKSTIHSY